MIVSNDSLHRMVMPLTVVYGHVQLLRRRLQRNQAVGRDDLEQALERMEQASREMVAELSRMTEPQPSLDGKQDAD